MLVCVVLLCLFRVALWSPAGRADLLAVVFDVICYFPKCVLVHIRGWRRETGLSPLVNYFTDHSKAVLRLWIFNGFFFCLVFSMPFVRVCLYVPYGHLLRKG